MNKWQTCLLESFIAENHVKGLGSQTCTQICSPSSSPAHPRSDRVAARSQPLRRSGVRQWSTGVWFPIALASGERSIQRGVSSSRLKTNASFLFGFRLIFKGNVTFLGFLFHLFIWFGRIWSMLDKQMPFTLRVSTGNRLFGQGLFNGSFSSNAWIMKEKSSDIFFHSSRLLECTAVYLSPNLGRRGNEEVPQNALRCLHYM